MYSGSTNQCYWSHCVKPAQSRAQTTKSPILACLGQFDIWLSEMLMCQFHTSFSPASPNPQRVPSHCLHTDPARAVPWAAQLTPHNSPLHKSQQHLSCTKRQEIVASKGNSMGSVQRQYPAWCIPTAPQNGPRFAAESPAHIPAPLTACLRNPLLTQLPAAPSTPHPAGTAAPPVTLAL